MFRPIYLHRIRGHAGKIFHSLFPQGYDGEIFLCGGAFKPLLKRGAPLHDLDLWVRNREEREKLCHALLKRGATLVHDFHPYCAQFRLDGQLIEITYHNVTDGTIADVLNTFDLTISGIGVRYDHGGIAEIHLSEECWHTIHTRQVTVQESHLGLLFLQKPASLLRTLHRLGQHAVELGYDVNEDCEHRLWSLYWDEYTEEERRAAMDLYFETMVAHQGRHDAHLVRRALVGYAPITKNRADMQPLILVPKAA